MNVASRALRHARISWKNLAFGGPPSPPFLTLFITSTCNLTCEHCFYWQSLNQRDDLTVEEYLALSRDLGKVHNLNLGGGEPFLQDGFAAICRAFVQNNGVEQIYCPSSGFFTDRTMAAVAEVLDNEPGLQLLAIELSLDGTRDFHNVFRGNERSFDRAMDTYDRLAELQVRDPRLRIHAISTATQDNLDEIRNLTEFLYQRCPAMDHHNIALIRGDRKNPSLQGPDLEAYERLHGYVRRLWAPREEGRFGAIVEPMLQWAKVRAAREQRQIVPCRAGILSAVVYANGDVGVCETLEPLGNLRERPFSEIWSSEAAASLRCSVADGDCYCTNEIFMWPSIVFQPRQLVSSLVGARAWRKPDPADRGQDG